MNIGEWIRTHVKITKVSGHKRHYKCGYCGYEFVKEVYSNKRDRDMMRRQDRGGGSTQVVCPQCGNYLTTWN